MATSTSECKQYLGYLSERSKDDEIPEECMTCQKTLECMLYELKRADELVEGRRKTHSYMDDPRAKVKKEYHKLKQRIEAQRTSLNAFQMIYARLRSFLL